jgi:hypothetical protein
MDAHGFEQFLAEEERSGHSTWEKRIRVDWRILEVPCR